jgi:hypothetical protein
MFGHSIAYSGLNLVVVFGLPCDDGVGPHNRLGLSLKGESVSAAQATDQR